MKRLALSAFVALLSACAASPLEVHVRTLASAEFEGRETGTDGERRAADYIEGVLRAAGAEDVRRQDFKGHGTTGRNVVAVVKGTSSQEAVLLGAHYDHLGLAKDGTPHFGADDNASGTAVVLEVAGRLARAPGGRTVVFALFSGEEMGILGSRAYVNAPVVALEKTVAMINLDMVGRLKDRLIVFGADTGDSFRAILESSPIPLAFNKDPIGPSDHTAFILKGVPAMHLFTGAHPDWHQTSDTVDKINIPGLGRVADLVERLVRSLADAPQRPVFRKPEGTSTSPRAPAAGAMPYLGLMPDYGYDGQGVRLAGTAPGSPAEKAGFLEGDVIRSLDGRDCADVKAYSALFFGRRPGDEVTLGYERGGKAMSAKVVLGEKRRSDE